jgi:deoxyribose-phosphate aldolase
MNNFSKETIVSLIDLTTLNDTDTDTVVIDLCKKASTPMGNTAAICIYKQFINIAKPVLNKDIPIATVINFPKGEYLLKETLKELEYCLEVKADEVDLVMPYQLIAQGDYKKVEDFITEVKKNCHNTLLKVIIESGELKTEENIKLASKISINAGVDFIKTSTGKVKVNATLEAAKIMLNEIKASGTKCGFKAAGGVKTYEEAIPYLELATEIMGQDFISPKTFRFGASSLLDNLLGKTNQNNY